MTEEIRKNELCEDELEIISGGCEIDEMPGWQEGITPVGAIVEA